MSDKKCQMCGANAEWTWDGNNYCQFCLCIEFDVWGKDAPCICEMCGVPLDKVYYTDSEGTPFCAEKCALEFHGASEIEEEK